VEETYKGIKLLETKGYYDFTDYQNKARGTAKYPVIGHGVIYPTLGLTNEAGEVAGKIKKIFPRQKTGSSVKRIAKR